MLQTPDRSTKVLLELADYMEKVEPHNYSQPIYNACCDRGCIAFHATRMLGIVINFAEVGPRLGLTAPQARLLFHADAGQKAVMGLMARAPTPKEAAKAIRHLAVTGDVPEWWTTFIPYNEIEALRDACDSGDVLHDAEPVHVS